METEKLEFMMKADAQFKQLKEERLKRIKEYW